MLSSVISVMHFKSKHFFEALFCSNITWSIVTVSRTTLRQLKHCWLKHCCQALLSLIISVMQILRSNIYVRHCLIKASCSLLFRSRIPVRQFRHCGHSLFRSSIAARHWFVQALLSWIVKFKHHYNALLRPSIVVMHCLLWKRKSGWDKYPWLIQLHVWIWKQNFHILMGTWIDILKQDCFGLYKENNKLQMFFATSFVKSNASISHSEIFSVLTISVLALRP